VKPSFWSKTRSATRDWNAAEVLLDFVVAWCARRAASTDVAQPPAFHACMMLPIGPRKQPVGRHGRRFGATHAHAGGFSDAESFLDRPRRAVFTTGGPGFGFEHFKSHDFLREGEVVLTFDDGPWPKNTPAVLAALAAHCTKAIFFPIGLHATYEPGILKQVAAVGHAVGSHTWCHQDLSKTKGECQIAGKTQSVEYDPKDEIEKGVSAVRWAVGGPTAPYFRFPALRQPQELIDYLGKRNIGIFSADMDSFDFKMRKPEQVRQAVMAKLKKHGKGIVLMHDFQHATAEAAMDLLNDLKAGGYKIVFMQPKFAVTTIAAYDEAILKQRSCRTV
jgi:peptidoglycan/xylan/chitin deacetylase (PgdA/CDA1 family)